MSPPGPTFVKANVFGDHAGTIDERITSSALR
jgi:hypothetical protein